MDTNKKTTANKIKEFIRVRINNDIVLTVNDITDFQYWKSVYPNASIL